MGGNHGRLMVFIVLCFFTRSESWNWFSSSSSSSTSGRTHCGSNTVRGSVAEYSAEGLNDERGIKLVENAKEKMVRSNWCWQNAYKNVFAGCSEILADEEKRSRLAWHLSDCFQRDSGRPHFPHCDAKSPMSSCLKALDDLAHKVYLEFYLETNTICHQLQAHAFKHETERLITDLKISAHYVEDKLDAISDKSENLLQESKKLHDFVDSFDVRTQQIVETVVNVEDRTKVLMRNSESIFEQGKKIADSQLQFAEVQEDMKMRFKEGIEILKESQNNLGEEIGKIRDESIEIQKEIIKVGDTMSQEMQSLHSKTENIVHLAAISLDKQQHLIHGQSKALDNLNSLSEFQSKALHETRLTFQQLAEFGQRHHQELLLRQEQVQGLHDRLMTNTKSILSAQESFESKQASMFAALDKIFSLQNAMFVESRMIKAFIVYFVSILVIYMLTSTKQTYNTRPWLYIGLCVVFLMEISIVRFTNGNIEQQACIISIIRSVFMIIASAQLLYAIFTYRNYEVLSYHMLQTLNDKLSIMEQRKKLAWVTDEEEDDDLDWSRWIDTDLPEEVNCIEDPDFIFPEEEVGENSITVSSRKYNLRSRRSHYL
ncbi:protein GAMETE EXPRESSED 1 [Neltuma alba]|uniref:protein GAMETE EXPRESSED 1 n=1 Tax=Neltuma alba TaxID=207710 RepID=UPI0010A3CDDE|nr:protein GAMETE EXPRESSED 1 [Prosopis alba]